MIRFLLLWNEILSDCFLKFIHLVIQYEQDKLRDIETIINTLQNSVSEYTSHPDFSNLHQKWQENLD